MNGYCSLLIASTGLFLAGCTSDRPLTRAADTQGDRSQYTVYFGFDRADLSANGAETVSSAARAADRFEAGSISVIGHTDTAGSQPYNQALSEARADAVVAALVQEDVNRAIITASGRSELDLAVATADGVREPRNRRVEIDIN